jgi:hypothetical protein
MTDTPLHTLLGAGGSVRTALAKELINGGILKYRRVREWSRKHHGLHVFDLPATKVKTERTAAGFITRAISRNAIPVSAKRWSEPQHRDASKTSSSNGRDSTRARAKCTLGVPSLAT